MTIKNIDGINLIEEYELVYEEMKYLYSNFPFYESGPLQLSEIYLMGNEPKHDPSSLFSILLFIKLQVHDLMADLGSEIYNRFRKVFCESKIIPVDGDIYSPIETIQVLGLYPPRHLIDKYTQQISEVTPILLKYIGKELSGDSDGLFKNWDDYLNFTKMLRPHLNDFMSKLTAGIMEFSVRLRIENHS